LIVEDDPPSAKLIALLLTAQGATVRIAPNAEEALLIIDTFLPRLVVLDLVLPRMGGLLLAQHIKADPKLSKIVVVAATAVNGPEVERVVREAGCVAYFCKPIDTETFATALANCLERK
jgi:CheY-like chemotaxis protein